MDIKKPTKNANGNPVSGENEERNSGFNGTYTSPDSDNASLTTGTDYPDKRYYDLYLAEQENYNATFYRRILGDATGEMGPFGEQYYYNTMKIQISSWYSDIINSIKIPSNFYSVSSSSVTITAHLA